MWRNTDKWRCVESGYCCMDSLSVYLCKKAHGPTAASSSSFINMKHSNSFPSVRLRALQKWSKISLKVTRVGNFASEISYRFVAEERK